MEAKQEIAISAEHVQIRAYRLSDHPMIRAWWEAQGEKAPWPSLMPLQSSFVAEVSGEPALAVCLYLTNTPDLAYVENFVGNPEMKGDERKQAAQALSDHILKFAGSLGYRRLLCMTEKPALVKRYQELGFTPTLVGVTTLVRSV